MSKQTTSGADKTVNAGGGISVALSGKWGWKCPTCKTFGTAATQAQALEKMYGDARGLGKHCVSSSNTERKS